MKYFLASPAKKKLSVVLHDLFMVAVAWQLAWWARFNFDFPFFNWDLSLTLIPVLLVVQGALFWYFHLYRALWRFASLLDLWNIFRASIVGAMVTALAFFVLFRLEGVPRSVLFLYPVLLIFLLGGPRLGYRLWKDRNASILSAVDKKRVLVIGGGRAGDMLVRDMHRRNSDLPVAILDDDASLLGAEIHGIKINGAVKDVATLVSELDIDWIVIAIPSASRSEMQTIVESCERTNLPIRTLPDIRNLKASQDLVSELREVSIEDLLGREPVDIDWKNITSTIHGRCVLVTGGGGSIGSILAEQILELEPSMLIVVDRSEYNLYSVEQSLASSEFNAEIVCVLGDICDEAHMSDLFQQYHPQLVFHAAAFKHVPLLEDQPREALKNNIFGTKKILDIACFFNVEKFVLISTDKAVNPSNVLGVSKRVAEKYTESINHLSKTHCITVRFGNVLDSAGSVVPLFRKQIQKGGPVTVTHPDITRFFMTISEASQLILQAVSMGEGGEIFVLDMGEPVKIQYLAEQMILLSGRELNNDIAISYCGLRPGEKLYEELFYLNEQQSSTSHEKIFLAKHSHINAEKCVEQINYFVENNLDVNAKELNGLMFEFLALLENTMQKDSDESNVIPIASKN